LRAGLEAVGRLIDALVDPLQRERTALLVLAAYIVVWTLYGVLAKASQDMQVDAAELVAWGYHPALGYAKHPPLAAWLVRAWFTFFPVRDWSYYLLAITYATTGLWLAWRLYSVLPPDKRIVALACLTLVPYYNFHGLRFDHNAVLGPLWVATALCFIRSFETHSRTWAALAGAAAAAAMLGKYWSFFLIAGLGVAAIADTRRMPYFRSATPWITIAVGILLLAPHCVWLVQHQFQPMAYALSAHEAKSFGSTLVTAGRYLAGAAGYAAAPTLAVLVLTRPRGAVLVDMVLPRAPNRSFIVVAFCTTLLLPVVFSPVLEIDLNPIWSMSILFMLPLILLSPPALSLNRQAVTAIAAFAAAIPLVMLVAAPAIALVLHVRGVDPVSANAQLLAVRINQEWQKISDRPLRIVGGDFGIAHAIAFYLPGRAVGYPVLEPETAPWVTPERIARDGAAMVCNLPAGLQTCTPVIQQAIDGAIAGNPPAHHVQVLITRRFLGIAATPVLYLIILVPPRP
jgi:hypothetical protein